MPLTGATFTRESSRHEVCAVDNRKDSSQETIISSHVLFGVICLEWLGVLGQRFWPGCWLGIYWHYTHTFSCGYGHMFITLRGGELNADLNTGSKLFSLPTLFTEEFSLPKSTNLSQVYNSIEFCISFIFQIFISSCPNLWKSFHLGWNSTILAKSFFLRATWFSQTLK